MARGMQSADAQTRTRVASSGGYGRAAALTSEERSTAAATAARAMHTSAALARRIVKAWPGLSDAERVEVLAILRPLKRHQPNG